MPAAPFVVVTPNPAIDRVLELGGALEPGRLHRVRRAVERAGGKGMNVARVLRALGVPVVTAGFLAGFNGRKFRAGYEAEGIEGRFLEVEGDTRECQIVLGSHGHPTELNEAGPHVGEEGWRGLFAGLPAGPLVISGSLPPGVGPDRFEALLRELRPAPVVDAGGAFLAAALRAGVRLVAPNRIELAEALGLDEPVGPEQVGAAYRHFGVPILATLGPDGVVYTGADGVRVVTGPRLEGGNPVGAGGRGLGRRVGSREHRPGRGRSDAGSRVGEQSGLGRGRQSHWRVGSFNNLAALS